MLRYTRCIVVRSVTRLDDKSELFRQEADSFKAAAGPGMCGSLPGLSAVQI